MKAFTSNDPKEIEQIIAGCKICTLSLVSPQAMPYAVPMNFYYEHETVYLHCGAHGTKNDFVRDNPNVCITFTVGDKLVHQHADVACSFNMRCDSVQLLGKVEVINDLIEKKRIMDRMMYFYTGRQDFNYSQPALENVVVWEVKAEKSSAKSLGLTYQEFLGKETNKG